MTEIKNDCVLYKETGLGKSCTILKILNCEGCRFYKTQKQVDEQLKKCKERLERLQRGGSV